MNLLVLLFLALTATTTFAGGYYGNGVPNATLAKANELVNQGHELKEVSFDKNGGWIIFYDHNGYWAQGISQDAFNKVAEISNSGQALRSIAFGLNNAWIIFHGDNAASWNNIPQSLADKVLEVHNSGMGLRDVAFTPDNLGWAFTTSNGALYYSGMTSDFINLVQTQFYNSEFLTIAFGPNGGAFHWVFTARGNQYALYSFDAELDRKMQDFRNEGLNIIDVSFTPAGGWFVVWH